jgi:hypothetical protein
LKPFYQWTTFEENWICSGELAEGLGMKTDKKDGWSAAIPIIALGLQIGGYRWAPPILAAANNDVSR